MTAWYNEIDPFAAQMLRNLIDAGHIAYGVVDERSIEDVKPDELAGYTQCHFFAGVGVWSYALRLAGWPDDRKIWTASCPCQPFSTAGKGVGFDDKRHLWPHLQWLINQCSPTEVIGEQVASKDADHWIDLVQADLEAMGYAFGCVPFPAAGVGAPHIRDRNYWVAYSESERRGETREHSGRSEEWIGDSGEYVGLANTNNQGPQGWGRVQECSTERAPGESGMDGGLADTASDRLGIRSESAAAEKRREPRPNARWELAYGSEGCAVHSNERSSIFGAGPGLEAGEINGFWRDADWIHCRDGKWRPVEPGTFPLAYGIATGLGRMQPRLEMLGYSPEDIKRLLGKRNSVAAVAGRNRVGRLRCYGNAINAQAAKVFIECVMESMG